MEKSLLDVCGFLTGGAVIVFSGSRLARYADRLSDLLGWGRLFMGILLVAGITSLPELLSGISSVVLVDAPDLAVADIVGSCAFNVLIISILDIFYDPKKPVTSGAPTGHVIAAALSIISLCAVALAILMPAAFGRLGNMGGYSLVFIVLYIFAMRIVFLYDRKQASGTAINSSESLGLGQVIFRFGLHSLLVMMAALTLPYFGERLAQATGLGQSFFGTLFIAMSTSLPEIVVSVAAVRMGSIDLAIGNIFGSNIFNIGILAIDDMLYKKGPLFSYTSPNHIIPVMGTIIITAVGIIGIVYKSPKKWKLAIDTATIVAVYMAMLALLYVRK